MTQYINKSALVAEIKKRIKEREEEEKKGWAYSRVKIVECEYILSLIDTLEVKELSKDLEEAAKDYSHNLDSIYGSIGEQTRKAFKAGAKWGMRQAEVKIQAQSMALAHGCPNDFAGSNLEEKANQLSQKYFPDEENIWARSNIEAHKCKSACIEMVEWLKAQKVKEVQETTAADRGMAEEIIINLKRVEQDYHLDLTKEMEWLRKKTNKL